jgi:F-type H+-transporting ATPase subunit gamma
MSENTASLTRKISSAGDLQSVVRTMKALAASSIGQYDKSVRALGDYYRTVELGLGACFRESGPAAPIVKRKGQTDAGAIGAVVFGSDQGLVGQFNDVVADYAVKTLAALPGKPEVWAVGERVHARLVDAGLPVMGCFAVPNSVQAITPLVGQIQIESEARRAKGEYVRVYVFHNRPKSGALYEPVSQRLLPLDAQWQQGSGQSSLADEAVARSHVQRHRDSARAHPRISFHLASSAPAPNPSPARTRAVWPRWNAPIKTLMICWRRSTPPSTEYARRALTSTVA